MIFIDALLMVLILVGMFLAFVIPAVTLVVLTMMIYTASPLVSPLPAWARLTVRIAYPFVLLYLTALVMLMNGAVVL